MSVDKIEEAISRWHGNFTNYVSNSVQKIENKFYAKCNAVNNKVLQGAKAIKVTIVTAWTGKEKIAVPEPLKMAPEILDKYERVALERQRQNQWFEKRSEEYAEEIKTLKDGLYEYVDNIPDTLDEGLAQLNEGLAQPQFQFQEAEFTTQEAENLSESLVDEASTNQNIEVVEPIIQDNISRFRSWQHIDRSHDFLEIQKKTPHAKNEASIRLKLGLEPGTMEVHTKTETKDQKHTLATNNFSHEIPNGKSLTSLGWAAIFGIVAAAAAAYKKKALKSRLTRKLKIKKIRLFRKIKNKFHGGPKK